MRVDPNRSSRSWLAAAVVAAIGVALYSHVAQPGKGERLNDFSKAYYAAGDAVLHGGATALWPLIASAEFVNIPIVAWLFAPLAMVGPLGGKLIFSVVGLLAATAACVLMARFCQPRRRPLVFLLFVLNGPLWYSVMIGNTTHDVLLLLVVALILWDRGWLRTVGLLLGTAAVMKPMFLLFGVYFVWRRNWPVVLAAACVIVGALLASIAVFGLPYTIGWYQHCIATFAGKPMGAANNQSLDAFLLRLWTGPALLRDWHAQALPVGARLARSALVGALGLLTMWVMWRNRRPSATGPSLAAIDTLDYCLMLNLCIVLSSVSWTHYYTVLLIPFGLHVAGRLPMGDDRLSNRLLLLSIVLCSIPVRVPWLGLDWLPALSSRSVESVWFIGALLLLASLFRMALRYPVAQRRGWGRTLAGPMFERIKAGGSS